MHLLKKPLFKLLTAGAFFALLGCGVKGDPLPPEKPPEIGRGRPTYKRATENIKIKKTKTGKAPGKGDEEDDSDERE